MAAVEPPTKKAKTEETPAAEPAQAALEQEQDAPADKGPKIKALPLFHVEDTTINVMNSTTGSTLMPLTDGGLQYLLAGARANVGLKSGRYMFEVRVLEVMAPLEDPNAKQRVSQPRAQIRIGFCTETSSLFLGEGEDSVGFDSEGFFFCEKKKNLASQKFGSGDVVSVLLNLEDGSPNAHTISLFKDGVRVAQPQPLPDSLKGKTLYPLLTFKNATLLYNFSPESFAPLPFKCRMVQEAAQKDAIVKAPTQQPKDGKFEVLFPVGLPDQGVFDWLDLFLEKNSHYAELSDRAILKWCEQSGIFRPKGYSAGARTSNDKPEMGFGISALDDLSVRRVLQAVAPIQKRHYVVVEIRANLLKDLRKELTEGWSSFKTVATIVIGEPPAELKEFGQSSMLKQKQEASDAEFKSKLAQEKQKRLMEKRQKQMEIDKQNAIKKQQKMQEQMKKKIEFEKKKKEAEAKGEPAPEEEKEDAEEEPEQAAEVEEEPMDEEPPTVELSDEEQKLWFRKPAAPDLTPYLLNTSFQKFSLPEKNDGFDEIKYEWQSEAKCKQYFKEYVQNMKLTSRIEDLQPSEWFNTKWKSWQKILQSWHAKQNGYKAKLAEKAAKEAKRKAQKEAGNDVPMEDEEPEETAKADFDNIDVFAQEDIMDIGGGEPLFSAFTFEDWTMMSLRFELHLLAHAFRRDVNDPERVGIQLEHLPFYYNKYFKKALNIKFYGVESLEELLEHVRDAVLLSPKQKVLEPMLHDELEAYNIFIMVTEEARRDRNRRVDMGDDSAKLKIASPGASALASITMTSSISSSSIQATAAAAAAAAAFRPAVTTTPTASLLSAQVKMTALTNPAQQMQQQMQMQQMQQMQQQAWNQPAQMQMGGWGQGGWGGGKGMGGFGGGKGWGKGW